MVKYRYHRQAERELEGTPIKEKRVRPKSLLDFPFTIQYMFYDNIVYIVAVAHQSRRPGYWKGRIKDARFD
jgi:hypothetical protein